MNYVLTILIQSTALHTAIHSVLSSASAWYSTARFNSVIQSTHLLNSHTHIHHTHFCYTCVVLEIFCYLSHSFICLSVFLCQAQMLIMIERLVFHNGTSNFITYLALGCYLFFSFTIIFDFSQWYIRMFLGTIYDWLFYYYFWFIWYTW